MKNQFFILGRERSGTTLLRSILHQHPHVVVPPESTFIWDLWPIYKRVRSWPDDKAKQFAKDLRLDPRFKFWDIDEKLLLEKLSNLPETSTYAEVCQHVLSSYTNNEVEHDGSEMWLGDKNPVYVEYVPFLLQLYPKARFVCIVRDYKDSLASIWPTGFEARWTAGICHKWVRCYEDLQHWREKLPEQFDTIRYEDLVTQPREILEPILKNFQLNWNDELLEFNKTTGKTLQDIDGSARAFVQNLDQPLNSKSIGRWKQELSPTMVKIADDICVKTAAKFGYDSTDYQDSSPKKYRLAKVWSRLYFNIEKTSQRLPPSLKRLYLKLKWRFNGGWTKAVKETRMGKQHVA